MAIEFINVKCTNCKGTGHTQIGPNIRGIKKCPICNGSGKKRVQINKYSSDRKSKED